MSKTRVNKLDGSDCVPTNTFLSAGWVSQSSLPQHMGSDPSANQTLQCHMFVLEGRPGESASREASSMLTADPTVHSSWLLEWKMCKADAFKGKEGGKKEGTGEAARSEWFGVWDDLQSASLT